MPPAFDFIFTKSPLLAGILQLTGALQLLQLPLMFKAIGPIVALITTMLMTNGASAGVGNDRVTVGAIADVSSIQPGKPFWIGFTFTIKPGFHIYWKNPGDSGLATQVKLTLPQGFSAGELMFPVPDRLKLPGDILNYAYQNKVMLLTQITPPKALQTGSTAAISAKVNWLVCKDDCAPGSDNVFLSLPVSGAASPANEELFKSWGGRLPTNQDTVDIASVEKNLLTDKNAAHGKIKITWKITPTDIQYLPGPLRNGDTDGINVRTEGTDTQIDFEIRNYAPEGPVSGLVTFTTPSGMKTGLDISIPEK